MVASQAFSIRKPPAYAVIKAIKKAGIKIYDFSLEPMPLVIVAGLIRLNKRLSEFMLTGVKEIGRRFTQQVKFAYVGEFDLLREGEMQSRSERAC